MIGVEFKDEPKKVDQLTPEQYALIDRAVNEQVTQKGLRQWQKQQSQ